MTTSKSAIMNPDGATGVTRRTVCEKCRQPLPVVLRDDVRGGNPIRYPVLDAAKLTVVQGRWCHKKCPAPVVNTFDDIPE